MIWIEKTKNSRDLLYCSDLELNAVSEVCLYRGINIKKITISHQKLYKLEGSVVTSLKKRKKHYQSSILYPANISHTQKSEIKTLSNKKNALPVVLYNNKNFLRHSSGRRDTDRNVGLHKEIKDLWESLNEENYKRHLILLLINLKHNWMSKAKRTVLQTYRICKVWH